MSDKSGLCLWCGRWTESRTDDGLADCDRAECIVKRVYGFEEIDVFPKKYLGYRVLRPTA